MTDAKKGETEREDSDYPIVDDDWQLGYDAEPDEEAPPGMDELGRLAFYAGKADRAERRGDDLADSRRD